MVALGVGLFYAGDDESRGFPSAILRAGEQVAALQHDRDGLLLDGRRPFKALLVDAHQELPVLSNKNGSAGGGGGGVAKSGPECYDEYKAREKWNAGGQKTAGEESSIGLRESKTASSSARRYVRPCSSASVGLNCRQGLLARFNNFLSTK